MAVDQKTVSYIAGLSRLAVSEHEVNQYAESLSRILELVEQMHSVDTDQIEPMAHPQNSPLILRDDQVLETDNRDAFLALAPATRDGLYLVPKVLE